MLKRKCCNSCGQKKELSEYSKNSNGRDGLDWYCRDCKKDKASKYYQDKIRDERKKESPKKRKDRLLYSKIQKDKFRQYIQDIKSRGCCMCSEKTLQCLDFHHTNPKDKKYDISDMISHNIEKIIIEIQKCIVVCSNCHRKIHYGLIECPNVSPNTIGLPPGAL